MAVSVLVNPIGERNAMSDNFLRIFVLDLCDRIPDVMLEYMNMRGKN